MLKAAALTLPLFLLGCNDAPADAGAGRPAGAPRSAAPVAALAAINQPLEPQDPQMTGTVVETMNAGQYTYIRLKTSKGDIWAAVTQQALKAGSEVTIGNAMWMDNFESKTLNRTFEHILFGAIVTPGSAASAELPPGHPPTTKAAAGAPKAGVAETKDVKVDKASGKDARTVAEIWAGKATLKGAEVVVRGRVVKFNAEIMGRNWIHLRDGSGSQDKQDNDITVTTTDVVAMGDIVTVRGKVALDQDFTAGYSYPVMIEGAKVIK
jgi:hypothetical protein